jgi:DNA-binding HxlR family transcriptional regulator
MATTDPAIRQPGHPDHAAAPHPGAGFAPFCPAYHRAVELIGRRWSGAVVRALLSGATRFSEIVALIPGLSDRLLSERLKELEAEGIVTRTVIPETPVRVEYGLTEKGQALAGVVEAISTWAETWLANATADHDRCHPDGPCTEPE